MTDTDISIDMERIEELIEEYANAKRRQKKREIENEVLAETVWKALPENHPGQLVLTEDQVERIRRSLPDDEEEADRRAAERLAEAREDIEDETDEIAAEGESDREAMIEQAEANEDDVVEYVVEEFEDRVHAQA